ncbi:PQQ-dependent sugar dehydrogenase [Luteolibacter ambystomatis]|uniref:PQQ-dependent sugar dehydrogenase n=1 Tax=Luteolibacter ambystomatis TaxID=2824561 RepID=A0A975IZ66_9BACT|nr:PQQ-dependent sugar dehydrogenase [Luteolibacter ambystomatis]QUE50864.1 PQQ-dependent sugar dehydrogenase [Luteolibacter ambystomatis]
MKFFQPSLPAVLLAAVAGVAPLAAPAATLPAGFAETRIATGLNPVTMTFAPDGRLFLCEKQGLLRVIEGEKLVEKPLLDLTAKVDGWNERGLLSVCFDPDYARNGWIYVYYTHNRKPEDTSHQSSNNRVSRFTIKGGAIDPATETVILELTDLSKIGWHNGGGLRFGKDGKLYVGTGENANGGYAQDGGNLLGKLLRINKDGSIPSDNPYYREFKDQNRAIVALGLRNPFSIAVQPGTGLLYLSMVGANFEQIERYETGSAPEAVNYGWPDIDGPPKNNQKQPPGYRAPAYAYDHGSGKGVALCAGDFYNPAKPGADAFPAEYTGKFFFSDYGGWIKLIDPAKPETRLDFATGIDRPIAVATAPDGALWYIERAGIPGGSDASNTASKNGSLWRIRWSGGGQPTKLAMVRQPGGANVGTSLGDIQVALQGEDGKTLTSATDSITISLNANPGNGRLIGSTTVAAVNGVASFSGLSVDQAGRGYTLRASNGKGEVTSAAFDIANGTAAPRIAPGSGNFTGPVTVRIVSDTPGATLRYTLDGKDPTDASPVYSTPFQITANQTVKAIAGRKGLTASAVVSADLKITGNKPYGLDDRPPVAGLKLPATAEAGLPATLSATGIFADRNLTPKPGVVPYSLNSGAWADGARVQRWIALPPSGRISFSSTGEFTWPGGTVLVQHFEIASRRLDTRVLVLDTTGKFGYGASYRWRPDNSDADLVPEGGQEEVLKVADAAGATREQTWTYPARGLCVMCHTPNAGFVLGPKARQLNGNHAYPGGRTDNQLRTWSYLQMFEKALDESAIKGYAHTVAINDGSATVEARVRSYLDANCAQCHRPNGTGALWDARLDTPLSGQGILGGEVRNTLNIEGAKIVAQGDVAKSILHHRMASTSLTEQMPPLTRNVPDAEALKVLEQWIRGEGKK